MARNTEQLKMPTTTAGSEPAGRKIARNVIGAIFSVYEGIVPVLVVFMALAFLLNACGYGYQASVNPPQLDIKPLSEMRQINEDRRFSRAARFTTMQQPMNNPT